MADRTTAEYYVAECMVKCSQAILGARIYQAAKPVVDKRASKWFMLQLEEVDGLKQQLLPWHKDPTQPLVIEVFMHPWAAGSIAPAATPAISSSSGGPTPGAAPPPPTELLLERWTFHFARTSSSSLLHIPPGTSPGSNRGSSGLGSSTSGSSGRGGGGGNPGGSARAPTDDAGLYKRLILLVRALYTQVRVLPAYRIYRACKRHQGALYQVGYRLQTHPSPPPSASGGSGVSGGGAGAPHPGAAQPAARLQLFQFAGVELPGAAGVLEVMVEYSPKPAVHLLEQTAGSTLPAAPRIIADYMADLEDPGRSGAGAGGGAARSAPAARGGLGAMLAAAAAAAAAGVGDAAAAAAAAAGLTGASQGAAGSVGGGGVLRLHHAASPPIVRHTWSSRDMPARVVQRGFVPRTASLPLSPPAADAAAADADLGRSSSAGGAAGMAQHQQASLAPTWSGGSATAGPSSGKPPLPHAYTPPVGSTSPSTPQSVPRCSGLHRLSSSGKLGATGTYLFGLSPPSRVGSWGSTGGGGGGPGAAAGGGGGGYSSPVHRGLAAGHARGGRVQADPVGQQITGFAAAGSGGSSSPGAVPGLSAATAAGGGGAAAPGGVGSASTAAEAGLGYAGPHHDVARVPSPAGIDGAGGGVLPPPSAPVEIPLGNRSRARARSATDLSLMHPDAGLQVWDASTGPAGEAMAGGAGSGAAGAGGAAGAVGGIARAGGHEAASRRALQAALGPGAVALTPSSAPAAPRGMLGQLLNANRAAAAAAAAGGGGILAATTAAAAGGLAASGQRGVASSTSPQQPAGDGAVAAAGAHDGSSRLSPVCSAGSSGGPHPTSIIVRPSPAGTAGGLAVWGARGSSRAAGGWPTIATPAGLPGPSAALSCSPQLPFAFTPSAQSAASLGAHLFPSLGPGAYSSSGAPVGGPLALPSPPVPGVRDISGLATIRRPSWSSRSSSFDVAASTSMPHHMSVSPMADLLDPALLGSSAALGPGASMPPAAAGSRGPSSTPAAGGSGGGGGGGGATSGSGGGPQHTGQMTGGGAAAAAAGSAAGQAVGEGPQGTRAAAGDGASPAAAQLQHPGDPQCLLEHASGLGELDPSHAHQLLLAEESESDVLPFALEPEWATHPHYHHASSDWNSGSSPAQAQPAGPLPPPAGGGGGGGGGGGYAMGGARAAPGAVASGVGGPGAGPSRDVAVGAFIKLLQDAPPLDLPHGVSMGSPGVGQLVQPGAGQAVNPPALNVAEGLARVGQLCVSLQQLLRGR